MDSQDSDSLSTRSIHNAILELAEAAVVSAGKHAKQMQSHLQAMPRSMGREQAEAIAATCLEIITDQIHEVFPRHGFISEPDFEGAFSEFTWYVNPLDGITNYLHGIPLWGLSVAFCIRGKPAVAAVCLPSLDETYVATADGPAQCNGRPIFVSDTRNPKQALVLNGDFNTTKDLEIRNHLNEAGIAMREVHAATFHRVRCHGSPCVEAAWVACGRVDAYAMLRCPPRDVAAGVLLVERAGGVATGVDGSPWNPEVKHALLSNKALHGYIIDTYTPWKRDQIQEISPHTMMDHPSTSSMRFA